MELFTRKTLAASTADRWFKQYGPGSIDPLWKDVLLRRSKGRPQYCSSKDIYEELLALGPTPTPEEVDEVIGNSFWTTVPPCNECGRETDAVVRLGEEPDYESSTAWVCCDCLQLAVTQYGDGTSAPLGLE